MTSQTKIINSYRSLMREAMPYDLSLTLLKPTTNSKEANSGGSY